MKRHVALVTAGLAGLLVLAACGNNSPSPPSSPAPTAAPTLAPGSDTYPQHDTPVDQAAPALAATWKAYGVELIPGHSTVDRDARWPKYGNASGGTLSAAQANAIGDAAMRVQVLATWADEHRQIPLLPHLMNTPFLVGAPGVALAEGTSVHTPDCSTYPTELIVHAPSPALNDKLAKAGQNVGATALPLVMQFRGPCTLTGTTRDGRSVVVDTVPTVRLVVFVEVQDDPVLGPIAHLDAAASCTDPLVGTICAS
jgi:hypothetical protein